MRKSKRRMLINVNEDETRVALTLENELHDLHIEQTHNERIVGNIYRAKVMKIQSSFQAAFVNYGNERHGFLPLSDIAPHLTKGKERYRIEDVLQPGQTICVQVLKDEIGQKGAALTTNIFLPGRFLVFMPYSDKGGVSKKIEDPEKRQRLKDLLGGLVREKGSLIIRTAGIDRSLTDLKRDFMVLRRKWNQLKKNFESGSEVGLIYQEEDVVVRMLRDYFTDDIQEIWIDEPEAFQRALEFFRNYLPSLQKRLHLYVGERSLFSEHSIESQIEKLSGNQVDLPSGGSIVIDQTEALVAIDVNSGKSSQEKSIEDTAVRTNMEAAVEIARQLRLRNLGGLIVVDFIDMLNPKNREMVVERMDASLQSDKAKWALGSISQFGLLEMSRQRLASALSTELKTVCPTCCGSGTVMSVTSLANAVLRNLRELAATGRVDTIHGRLPLDLANHLLNQKRELLNQLQLEFDIEIMVIADLSVGLGSIDDFKVKLKGRNNMQSVESFLSGQNRSRHRSSKEPRFQDGQRARRSRNRDTPKRADIEAIVEDVEFITHGDSPAEEQNEKSSTSKISAIDSKQEAQSLEEVKNMQPAVEEVTEELVLKEQKVDKDKRSTEEKDESSLEKTMSKKKSKDHLPLGTLFSSSHVTSYDPSEEWAPAKLKKSLYPDVEPGSLVFSSQHRKVDSDELVEDSIQEKLDKESLPEATIEVSDEVQVAIVDVEESADVETSKEIKKASKKTSASKTKKTTTRAKKSPSSTKKKVEDLGDVKAKEQESDATGAQSNEKTTDSVKKSAKVGSSKRGGRKKPEVSVAVEEDAVETGEEEKSKAKKTTASTKRKKAASKVTDSGEADTAESTTKKKSVARGRKKKDAAATLETDSSSSSSSSHDKPDATEVASA